MLVYRWLRAFFLLGLALLGFGCAQDEIGSYRLDQALLLQAVCSGVDADLASTWSSALAESPLDTMRVGRETATSGDRSQAWFTRSDATTLFSDVGPTEEGRFEGLRELSATTVSDSSLGADFSGLLESDQLGCTFDLRLGISFSFEEDDWQKAEGTIHLELRETPLGDHRCDLLECRADFSYTATHVSVVNPGVFVPEPS
ncbi:MAG TPA: hypothetical protein DIU15_20655 [Deltaproteobacteria bacterium]|nr:hypothetical protein [Deltaproteobacteria bacterium]HCP48460.1 hypothetical protein [Deltaproteobacteria bacterium]|tara:strand:+ start:247 stop:849 length:603 start_codon:yes stop_codon:yes gene_type:complete